MIPHIVPISTLIILFSLCISVFEFVRIVSSIRLGIVYGGVLVLRAMGSIDDGDDRIGGTFLRESSNGCCVRILMIGAFDVIVALLWISSDGLVFGDGLLILIFSLVSYGIHVKVVSILLL